MQTQKFSLRDRAKSFHYAFEGLQQFFLADHNAIIHAIATIAVITMCCFIKLSSTELLFIAIAIGMVWMAELFNSAIEKLCDVVCPQKHPAIKFIKDLSAAAVLVSSVISVVIGCVIFIPKFL